MSPRILYHCPCSTTPTYLTNVPPSPATSALALGQTPPPIPSSSAYPLNSLHFCEECDSLRCSLCVTKDVGNYYCPNCLFEVPAASVRGEKAKCARNCFTCPVCTHTLNVVATDPGGNDDNWDPRSASSSVGESPYFLSCSVCRWDSKEVGLTFEKPTGLSLQLQRYEENASDNIEFSQLRSHFETFLRTQVPTSTYPGADRTNTSTAQSAAAAAAARSSKLLRDVPSLASDPRFASSFSGRSKSGRKANESQGPEELRPYAALTSADYGRDARRYVGTEQSLEDGKALGITGRKEQGRIEFAKAQTDESGISSLAQRLESPLDQSVKLSDLKPNRIPLRAKQTKRCPTCRHIIVKPDPKASSNRFKIKLMALNYLPEIQLKPPILLTGNQTSSLDERRRSVMGSGSLARRRVLMGSAGTYSGVGGGNTVNEESLIPGRSYLYEATFTNPLDDAMMIRLTVGRHSGNRDTTDSSSPSMEDGKEKSVAQASPSKQGSSSAKSLWSVTLSTSTFPISPFNEVWELDEDDSDLLDRTSPTKTRAHDSLSRLRGASIDEDEVVSDEEDDDNGPKDDREQKRSRTDVGGKKERRRKGDGIIKRKGHETTIGFECVVGREAQGEVEFPLQVTYSYSPEPEQEERYRSSRGGGDRNHTDSSTKTFTFWTIVRLGKVATHNEVLAGSGQGNGMGAGASGSAGSGITNAEARRSALDKRRSLIGLNVGSTGSTIRDRILSAKEESVGEEEEGEAKFAAETNSAGDGRVDLPRDKGNLALEEDE